MSKVIFQYYSDDGSAITFNYNTLGNLEEMLERYVYFLRGAGYSIDDEMFGAIVAGWQDVSE